MPSHAPGIFAILTRQCFRRFFDQESLSPQAGAEGGLAQVLGLLAVPTAFFTLLFRPFGVTGWSHVSLRYFFVCYSMTVIAFVTVLKWDALFPDRRDYQVLAPLPVRLGTLFLAKTAALALFLSAFLLVLNFFGVLFWPGVDGRPDVLWSLGVHVLVLVASGLFAALAAAALQGVLITLFSGAWLRRVCVCVQTVLLGLLVMVMVLIPLMGPGLRQLTRENSPLLRWFPVYWFIGWYEQLRPATKSAVLSATGDLALPGLAIAAFVFLVTYLPGYRRHARKVMDAPQSDPAGPGAFRRWLAGVTHRWCFRHPAERAVFHFIGETIARSMKHRIFLAAYGGLGVALGVISYGSGANGLLELPLTLSFILVSGLRAAFNVPSELAANWAFQITETGGVIPYLQATRKWILLCAVIPLFILLAPFEFAFYRPAAAMFHIAFGILLSAVLIEVMFFGFRKVPFTCACFPGKVNLAGLSILYVVGFTTYSRTMAGVEFALMQIPWAAIGSLCVLAGLSAVLGSAANRYMEREGSLDYLDSNPAVITIDLRNAEGTAE